MKHLLILVFAAMASGAFAQEAAKTVKTSAACCKGCTCKDCTCKECKGCTNCKNCQGCKTAKKCDTHKDSGKTK